MSIDGRRNAKKLGRACAVEYRRNEGEGNCRGHGHDHGQQILSSGMGYASYEICAGTSRLPGELVERPETEIVHAQRAVREMKGNARVQLSAHFQVSSEIASGMRGERELQVEVLEVMSRPSLSVPMLVLQVESQNVVPQGSC